MSRRNIIGYAAVLTIVLLAGCSGVLSERDGGATTQTPVQDETPTPTPQPTPTATPTPTAAPTPSPTPTPVPSIRDYEFYASQMANLYDDYPPRGFLYDSSGSAEDRLVSVTVTKPEGWTVQDAEMEAARDLALTAATSTHSTVEAAKETDEFLRPDTYRVRVVNDEGKLLSKTTFDGDTAARYVKFDVTVEEFASQIAQNRMVYNDSVTISKRAPEFALRAAEYRPLQYRHLQRIANGSVNSVSDPDIDRAVMLPEEETIYYENIPPYNNITKWQQDAIIQRTYLEAIKDIYESGRVNRYPHKLRVLTDVSYSRDSSFLTRIKTQWAFDYFAITNWTLPQNIKILPAAAHDAYYNKIVEERKSIEDDDNYDYVAEARSKEGNKLNATVHDAYVLVERDDE